MFADSAGVVAGGGAVMYGSGSAGLFVRQGAKLSVSCWLNLRLRCSNVSGPAVSYSAAVAGSSCGTCAVLFGSTP